MRAVAVAVMLAAAAVAPAQYSRQPGADIPVGTPPALRDVGLDQRLDEQVPLDLPFRDESGRSVTLGEYFDAKPVILVLVQYRCGMLCNQVLNGLVECLRKVPFKMGGEYRVVTVSFDSRETPELAAVKKANYVDHYGRPGADAGWHFLTGEKESLDRLCQAVGFRYSYDPGKDQFAHASGIMVLTPQGKIARYFYGISYSPRDVRLGLIEASQERIGSPVDQLLLFCFHYDATAGKYSAAVRRLVQLGGIVTLLTIGGFIALSWRRDRRRARRAAEGKP